LHVEPVDPPADRQALESLCQWCQRYSPTVGIEAPPTGGGPDTLLANIAGCAHLFGGEQMLARRVTRELKQRGFDARVAIADTVGAAWAVAHFGRACTTVPPGAQQQVLDPLPVAALRLPPETATLLLELGIESIGQLRALARASLPARLGTEVLRRLDQALGNSEEPIVARRALPPLEIDHCFEAPIAKAEMIEAAIEAMLRRLARRLAAQGQAVERLECRLYLASGRHVPIEIGLVRPRSASQYLMEMIRLRLESLRLPAPVIAIRLKTLLTAPQTGEQYHLFAAPPASQRQLCELLDRLSGRLGNGCVVKPRLVSDPQPERACRYDPVVGSQKEKDRASRARQRLPKHTAGPAAVVPLPALARPLRLLNRPLAARVWSVVPGGPLTRLQWQGEDERIWRSWGPERIQTGWWRGQPANRDYYQVETASGRRYWLFRRLRDGRWFLHGLFE
jgi:protein ImuB